MKENKLNKCEDCGYLHGCHTSECSFINKFTKEEMELLMLGVPNKYSLNE